MEPHSRFASWETGPIAESLAFSSYSQGVDAIWAHDLRRRYKIVLQPGYAVPASLDRGDMDAMWYPKGEVTKTVPVWDGFCPVALHEIILECFDYEGTSGFIKVIDGDTGKIVPDPRDPKVLKLRPRRKSGWGRRAVRNHLVDLYFWSTMLPGIDKTSVIYGDLLSARFKTLTNTVDAYQRYQEFHRRGLAGMDPYKLHAQLMEQHDAGKIRLRGSPCLGPEPAADSERLKADAAVPLYDISMSAMNGMANLSLEDVPGGQAPDSYYRLAVRKGDRQQEERKARNAGLEGAGDGSRPAEPTRSNPF